MNLSKLKTATFVGFVLVAIASAAGAGPVPALDLADLTKRADLIAVGTLTSVYEGGQVFVDRASGKVSARLMYGEIAVDHILKGSSDVATMRLQFPVPDADTWIGYGRVDLGSYRVFFLKLQGDHYEFVSPYHPPVSVSALGLALRERDQTVRLNAAAALLAANDVSALDIAESALLEADSNNWSEELHNLRVGVSQGLSQEAAVPALGRLLGARSVETRRAAASALRHTRSLSAFRHLGQALDDADFEVRFTAVRGLAETTGQAKWASSWDDFRVNEGRYVQYWKDWLGRR